MLQRWIELSQRKMVIPEQQIRSFVDRTKVLFAEVVESLGQPPSTSAGMEDMFPR